MLKWISVILIIFVVKFELNAQITATPDELKENLIKAKKENNKALIAATYTDLGKYYIEQNRYNRALEYLCKAKEYVEENNLKYSGYFAAFAELFNKIGAISASIEYEKRIFNLRAMDLGMYFSAANIGIGYLYLNENDSALHYMNEQLNVARSFKNYIAIASAYNNIGIVHLESGDYSKALHYFTVSEQKMIDKWPRMGTDFESESESFVLSVKENKGRALFYLKRYREAANMLEKIKDSGRYPTINNNVFALFESYLKLNEIAKAKAILTGYNIHANSTITEQILATRMKLELAIHINNLPAVDASYLELQKLYQLQLIQHRKDENRASQLVGKYLMIEMRYRLKNESEKSEFLASKLSFAKTRNSFTLFTLVTLILFMTIGVYLYIQNIKNKRRKLKLDLDTLQIENEKHEYKIKLQENILTEFAIDYNRNRQEEDHIIVKLKKLTASKTTDFKGELNTIIAEIKLRQNINEKIEVVSRESILLQEEFQQKLLTLNPHLTKSEIQLCFLLRLELTNKEIALYRNVSVDSIKVFKNRLRSKLDLPSADFLTDFLKSI